ncbi:MAG: pseudouridine synthase, partial [Patescibacteria group bacterium]
MSIVLQKYIAQGGKYSRREAEELIRRGLVAVNGKKAELGMRAEDGDLIEVRKRRLDLAKEQMYIKLNKPVGFTSTSKDFKGEKNIFDLVRIKEKLIIAGRLDKNSRGLILLTNDGELVQKITHPSFEHEKEYIITITEPEIFDNELPRILSSFKKGIDIGEDYGVVRVKDIRYLGANKFAIVLTQGKKRQLRSMFYEMGYQVSDLLRVRIGNLKLNDL